MCETLLRLSAAAFIPASGIRWVLTIKTLPAYTNLIDDVWVRFPWYEIREGYIQPARGATPEKYRPWLDFVPIVGKEAHKNRPYHPLLNLVAGLDVTVGSYGFTVSENQQDLILDWCARHGLLGILLQQLEGVVLPERKMVSQVFKGVPGRGTVRFMRTASGWQRDAPVRLGHGGKRPKAGAYMRSLETNEMKFERVAGYAAYFPGIAASKRWSQLPSPATDRFWALYAEPLTQFLRVALDLQKTIDQAGGRTDSDQVLRGIHGLRVLTAPVRTVPYQNNEGQFSVGWACHSLLASYAMMATLDLAQTRLLRCTRSGCGVYFISKSSKAQYCSPSCRSVVQMRRSRLRAEQRKRNVP